MHAPAAGHRNSFPKPRFGRDLRPTHVTRLCRPLYIRQFHSSCQEKVCPHDDVAVFFICRQLSWNCRLEPYVRLIVMMTALVVLSRLALLTVVNSQSVADLELELESNGACI